jgi:hypothetical protein
MTTKEQMQITIITKMAIMLLNSKERKISLNRSKMIYRTLISNNKMIHIIDLKISLINNDQINMITK